MGALQTVALDLGDKVFSAIRDRVSDETTLELITCLDSLKVAALVGDDHEALAGAIVEAGRLLDALEATPDES